MEGYGISTEVILREIDTLEQTVVTPRKSLDRKKQNSLENSSEPILAIESSNLVDISNISLPSCFSNSVVNVLDAEVLPIIDMSDPFMNFDLISSSINQPNGENITVTEADYTNQREDLNIDENKKITQISRSEIHYTHLPTTEMTNDIPSVKHSTIT